MDRRKVTRRRNLDLSYRTLAAAIVELQAVQAKHPNASINVEIDEQYYPSAVAYASWEEQETDDEVTAR